MKYNLFFIIFFVLIIQAKFLLNNEKRKELLNKFFNKINYSELESNSNTYNDYEYFIEEPFKKMAYDVNEIKNLMTQYDLPENFNYLDETGATIEIKNQGYCGSCWSFSASTALAYRFKKKYGIDVSLSPQYGISCYLPDCDAGNFLVDSQINLIKNGAVTESCFPYESDDGQTIPDCPSQCKDGTEFIRYYSQNAYDISNDNQELFNDLVILIMDQLVNQGPIVAGFDVYKDFEDLWYHPDICKKQDYIYTYDGHSASTGGHGIAIVGYGILGNKIYWLIQNSWGTDWCDNGFLKMEIGQFNEIAFSEPYIKNEQITPTEIEVNYKSQNIDCNLIVTSPSLENWNNSVNVKFKHENSLDIFDFVIGKNKIKNEDEISCNYEEHKILNNLKKGKYIYNSSESFGEENTFKLNSFNGKSFEFYGYDSLKPWKDNNNKYYVSEELSKIVFYHEPKENDDNILPLIKLFKANHGSSPLNCEYIKTSTYLDKNLVYCQMSNDALNFMQQFNGAILVCQVLCGLVSGGDIELIELNTKNYPVFKVEQLIKPNITVLTKNHELTLVTKVSGGTKFYQNDESIFQVIMEIENDNANKTVYAKCSTQINNDNVESNLTCYLDINQNYECENLYLLPYSLVDNSRSIFEVIIKETIKAGDGPIPYPDIKPTISSYLEYSFNLLVCLIVLLF